MNAKTITNRFGEKQTSWKSHKHPNNPNFMQVVEYMHIVKFNGKSCLYWRLSNASANDKHIIANISLEDAISKFTDTEVKELTEADFQNWLSQKKVK